MRRIWILLALVVPLAGCPSTASKENAKTEAEASSATSPESGTTQNPSGTSEKRSGRRSEGSYSR